MIDLFDRWLARLEKVLEALIALLVLGLVLIVSSQLVDRHLVTLPMAAPDQYARVMLVWLTFIGFAVAVKNGINIRVDIIDARLPAGVARLLEFVFDLSMLIITGFAAWHAWPLLLVGADQERLGTVLSEAWPTAALLVSGVFLVLFLVLRIVLRLAGRTLPRATHLE
ncbi:MAG TPA: TRAP transporter small permease subunit [Burkholderiales bacterium]|nr:TRAP transporter small permease subunit [Burkholderiales bacterium]